MSTPDPINRNTKLYISRTEQRRRKDHMAHTLRASAPTRAKAMVSLGVEPMMDPEFYPRGSTTEQMVEIDLYLYSFAEQIPPDRGLWYDRRGRAWTVLSNGGHVNPDKQTRPAACTPMMGPHGPFTRSRVLARLRRVRENLKKRGR